jgi:hypothetical protein
MAMSIATPLASDSAVAISGAVNAGAFGAHASVPFARYT